MRFSMKVLVVGVMISSLMGIGAGIQFGDKGLMALSVIFFGVGCFLLGQLAFAGTTVSFNDLRKGRYVKLEIEERVVELMPFTPGKKANSLFVHGVSKDVADFEKGTIFDIGCEPKRKKIVKIC